MKNNKKFIKNSVKQLDSVSLERVSGGTDSADIVFNTGLVTTLISVPVSLALGISSTVCQYRGKKRREQGNNDRADKLNKAGRVLSGLAVGTAGLGTVGAGMFGGVLLYDEITNG